MSHYVKLFGSILDSSVWQEPLPTRIVWITMMAMSNQDGEVIASVPGLAKRAGVTLEECEAAIRRLSEPDRYNHLTRGGDGAHIERCDQGWIVHDIAFFAEAVAKDRKLEENRERQAVRRKLYALIDRDGEWCVYCGSDRKLSVDHVVPRCQGGSDDISNLVVACLPCNMRKGGRTPDQAGMSFCLKEGI